MTKYILNDDDTVRVGTSLYSYKQDKTSPYIEKVATTINTSDLDAFCEIRKHGNENDTIKIKDGDILEPSNNWYVPVMYVDTLLVDLYELEETLKELDKTAGKVVKLTPSETDQDKLEFEKNDKKMSDTIDDLKGLVECAEGQGTTSIDGKTYDTAHVWREVAEIALDLANQQEWFDRYEDKFVD
ncbi:MAG: hypothetical protein NC090_06760 [Anaeroplasma bactoclasticum]|nr:hypothetical protein [Anaeroplasma bactoclasticum]